MNTSVSSSIHAVKKANRRLYDTVAGRYEGIDGRRNETLSLWIRARLRELADRHGNGVLLDLGSGSGLVSRSARGIFRRTIALDLSPRILASAGSGVDHRVAGDVDALPLAGDSVDVVSCFAVLHHLYDAGGLVREVSRVLRRGGGFWSDHDMDLAFYRRFRLPLCGYRRLRGADRKYTATEMGLDADTYQLAECRENGVDSETIMRQFQDAGMAATLSFHWFGLSAWSNRIFGQRRLSRGWAPLLRVCARK